MRSNIVNLDIQDSDLSERRWYVDEHGYAVRRPRDPQNTSKRYYERLHRIILERKLGRPLLPSEECEHIDTNPLNNHRDNLRVCNRQQNQRNRRAQSNSKSGYKGVSWCKQTSKWVARINVGNKALNLGRFINVTDAVKAYNTAATEYFGEFAYINKL